MKSAKGMLAVIALVVAGLFLVPTTDAHAYRSMYVRGSFNNWGDGPAKGAINNGASTKMTKSGSVWKVTIPLKPGAIQFKFNVYPKRWNPKRNWGNKGVADGGNIKYVVKAAGNYEFTFDEKTKKYTITKK